MLVFIDGTICDLTHRHHLKGTLDFEKETEILNDAAVDDAVECMHEVAQSYDLVYMGARSANTAEVTARWLRGKGFPDGAVVVGASQRERMALVRKLKKERRFVAGIGDRWDDNELHLELGCLSIILEEYSCNWDTVRKYLLRRDEES